MRIEIAPYSLIGEKRKLHFHFNTGEKVELNMALTPEQIAKLESLGIFVHRDSYMGGTLVYLSLSKEHEEGVRKAIKDYFDSVFFMNLP